MARSCWSSDLSIACSVAAGRSVFDLTVSARPRGSGAAGGREKTKTENTGGAGGARALSAVRPSPKGAQE